MFIAIRDWKFVNIYDTETGKRVYREPHGFEYNPNINWDGENIYWYKNFNDVVCYNPHTKELTEWKLTLPEGYNVIYGKFIVNNTSDETDTKIYFIIHDEHSVRFLTDVETPKHYHNVGNYFVLVYEGRVRLIDIDGISYFFEVSPNFCSYDMCIFDNKIITPSAQNTLVVYDIKTKTLIGELVVKGRLELCHSYNDWYIFLSHERKQTIMKNIITGETLAKNFSAGYWHDNVAYINCVIDGEEFRCEKIVVEELIS